MSLKTIQILNQQIDPDDKSPHYYRTLLNKTHFKYLTILPSTYDVDDLCFPPNLLELLPPFPSGDWNLGRIGKTVEDPSPHFLETSRQDLPSIEELWHPRCFDYLDFQLGEHLALNVYVTTSPHFEKPLIAKFARFPWEIGYCVSETRAYSWIEGHDIGPSFLGFMTEEGRAIGFLLEFFEGRHAGVSDLPACTEIVRRLHALGISHGDLNKYNFLISGKQVLLIDFEAAW